jgi:hypothetical protein
MGRFDCINIDITVLIEQKVWYSCLNVSCLLISDRKPKITFDKHFTPVNYLNFNKHFTLVNYLNFNKHFTLVNYLNFNKHFTPVNYLLKL